MSRRSPIAVLAVDPGASSGVALLLHEWKARPLLVGAWAPHGSSWPLRLARFREVLLEVRSRVEGLRSQRPGLTLTGAIEKPPSSSRQAGGKLAGVRGQTAWRGIGEAMGAWRMAAHIELGLDLEAIPVGWAREVGDIPVGKHPARHGIDPCDGWHRVSEAQFYVEGADAGLALLRPKGTQAEHRRTVDAAEAVLLGVCVCVRAWQAEKAPPARRGALRVDPRRRSGR